MSAASPTDQAPRTEENGSEFSLREKILEIISLDLRSLALFRIALGLLVVGEILSRMADLRAHYTNEGIYPTSLVDVTVPISLHIISGALWYQLLLFSIGIVFGLMLLVGWQTRLATLVSWFLMISLHSRNGVIMHSGDILMRLLLFWANFLPTAAVYSLDARRSPRPASAPWTVASSATVAYILQLCFVYWFAVMWKYDDAWRKDGTAVYYAMSVSPLASRWGAILLDYPTLMQILTFATLGTEAIGPVLLLFPFATQPLRIVAVLAFVGLHTGMGAFIVLGNFPWVCYVAWVAVLPPLFWELLARVLRTAARTGLRIAYADVSGCRERIERACRFLFLYPILEPTPALAKSDSTDLWVLTDAEGKEYRGFEAARRLAGLSPLYGLVAWLLHVPGFRELGRAVYDRFANRPLQTSASSGPPWEDLAYGPCRSAVINCIVVFLLVYVLLWNLRTIPKLSEQMSTILPRQDNMLAVAVGIDQSWGVYAPMPGRFHGWLVVDAELRDGTHVDLWPEGSHELTWERPPEPVSSAFINSRWRRYFMNLMDSSFGYLLPYYDAYLRREWSREHPDNPVVHVEMWWMRLETMPDHVAGPDKVLLYRYGSMSRDVAAR
jgi:hypothetical protein